MPKLDASAIASLDLETLMRLADTEGHFTIFRFTSHWKCAFGTPDLDSGAGRKQVEALPHFTTLKEALVALLKNRTALRDAPP